MCSIDPSIDPTTPPTERERAREALNLTLMLCDEGGRYTAVSALLGGVRALLSLFCPPHLRPSVYAAVGLAVDFHELSNVHDGDPRWLTSKIREVASLIEELDEIEERAEREELPSWRLIDAIVGMAISDARTEAAVHEDLVGIVERLSVPIGPGYPAPIEVLIDPLKDAWRERERAGIDPKG